MTRERLDLFLELLREFRNDQDLASAARIDGASTGNVAHRYYHHDRENIDKVDFVIRWASALNNENI